MNWSEGIQAFKSYLLLERGLSENTVVNYVYDVQKLVAYLETNNIAIGPGINPKNIKQFADGTFKEIHFSASIQKKRIETNFIPLNSPSHFDETQQTYADQTIIKQMISLIHE